MATTELDLSVMLAATEDIQERVAESTVITFEGEEGSEQLSDYFESVKDLIKYTGVLQRKYDGLCEVTRSVLEDRE